MLAARRVCELCRAGSCPPAADAYAIEATRGGLDISVRQSTSVEQIDAAVLDLNHHPVRREGSPDPAEPQPATSTEVRRDRLRSERDEIRPRRTAESLARLGVAPGDPTLMSKNPQNRMDRLPQASRGPAQACMRPRYTETSVPDGAELAMRAGAGLYARSVPGRSDGTGTGVGEADRLCGLGHIVADAAACG